MEISNFIFVLQKYLLSGRTVTLTFPSKFIMIFYQFVELSGSGFISAVLAGGADKGYRYTLFMTKAYAL
jgi:hypothetical protein